MKIKMLEFPRPEELSPLISLARLCREYDESFLSFPEEPELCWVLTDENGHPVSCTALCQTGEETFECWAFTHPEHRRKGYFSMLLEEMCREGGALEEAELCLLADARVESARKAAEGIRAEPAGSEHLMEAALKPEKETEAQTGAWIPLTFLPEAQGFTVRAAAGSCRLSIQGTSACLYELEILKELRGKGHGTAFIRSLKQELYRLGIRLLRLQVSGDNLPALSLYEKTGFRITETLLYYLY